MSAWKIAAAEHRIPKGTAFAAHKMVIVVDPEGRVVRQFNGLASWFDERAGRWRQKPIGYLPSDRLRAYDTDRSPQTFLPVHGCAPGGGSVDGAVAAGDVIVLAAPVERAALDARLAPALEAIARINALSPGPEGGSGVPYPFLGLGTNSNSVFATLVGSMGFALPAFRRPARIAPGCQTTLLSREEISALCDRSRAVAPLEP